MPNPHLAGFQQLEKRAGSLASGRELEVRLSIDSIFPNADVFAALNEFSRRFPFIQLTLRQAHFLSADSEFSVNNAQYALLGWFRGNYLFGPSSDQNDRGSSKGPSATRAAT